jgi:hypothetical protein
MLRSGAAEGLISLLNNDEDPLSDLSQRFSASFDFGDRLLALTGLSFLLRDGLLDHRQQLIAVWLLYSEHPTTSLSDHPFASIFQLLFRLRFTDPNALAPQLHDLLGCILGGSDLQSLASQPLRAILRTTFALPPSNPGVPPEVPNGRLSPVLSVPDGPGPSDVALSNSEILISLLQDASFWEGFEVPFSHGCPDVCPVFREEVCFTGSYSHPRFIFDDGIPVDSRSSTLALFLKALDSKLKRGETDSLLARLQSDATLSDDDSFPHSKVVSLIENNPEVAKEVIVAWSKRPGVIKFLLAADVTLASVEVIGHLIMSGAAPHGFFDSYITNSTKAVASIQN